MQLAPSSIWRTADIPFPSCPTLQGEIAADVCIIGAGITGLTAGVRLTEAGKRVVIVEAHHIGSGTTGGTSAHVTAIPDVGLSTLMSRFGESSARLFVSTGMAALDDIERRSRKLAGFARVPGWLYTELPDHVKSLREELQAARACGLEASYHDDAPLPFSVAGAVRIEHQALFQPLGYIHALVEEFLSRGGQIFEQTMAAPPKGGSPVTVNAGAGRVVAPAVIVATHDPYVGFLPLQTRAYPYLSYVIAAEISHPIPEGLYFDDAEPYRYTRTMTNGGKQKLVIGGADHKVGESDPVQRLADLEAYAKKRFPIERITHRWSAELFEPADGLPYVGALPGSEGLFVATGLSGHGLVYGSVAAHLLTDLVLGKSPALAELLSPSRLGPLSSAPHFLQENLDVGKELLTSPLHGESRSEESLQPGEGVLLRTMTGPLAVYRDESGRLHRMSPRCTHMGCAVHWNNLEKTWDCPCHGGRYSAIGERLYGPPPRDLKRLE